VYFAESKTGAPVAVKFIHTEFAHHAGLRERFMREAKIMVQLDHPGICKAYHFYQDTDQVAIIMEYLEGEDLQVLIDRFGPVQPAKVIEWYRQLLPAFQYAHDKGIIHRDVKPSNVILTKKNTLKVLDFSIAKIIDGAGTDVGLTGTRTMLGTPLYMSPEQIQTPKFVDLRSDIYSLGTMMFTLLAGQPPYEAPDDSQFGLQQQIVNQPLPTLVGIPEKLNRILAKATAKNRDYRYASCLEMLRDLESLSAPGPGIQTRLMTDTPSSFSNSQPNPPQSTIKTWMTSPTAMSAMSFFVPPVGAYLVSRNFRLLGDATRSNHWVIGAVVGIFMVLGLMQNSSSSSNSSLLVICAGLTWFVRQTVQKHQEAQLAKFKEQGGRFISGWSLLGIGILYTFAIVVIWSAANS
jgi:serine/threonine protein kinase